jgi:hypothetical protein
VRWREEKIRDHLNAEQSLSEFCIQYSKENINIVFNPDQGVHDKS